MDSPRRGDTDPEAARVQIELMRRAPPERRAALALSLSGSVIHLAKRALREAHPDASPQERGILFVSLHYGAELAEELRRFLHRPRA